MEKRRVAVVSGIPAPYREPVFEKLAQRPGVDLQVFYCAAGHDDVAWSGRDNAAGYASEVLPNWTPASWRRATMLGYVNPSAWTKLRRFEPDFVLVHGYNQATHWLAVAYCLAHGTPFGLRSDSNVDCDVGAGWGTRMRRRMLRWLTPRAAAILTIGTANRRYWERYGARPEQIFSAPYAIDNARVARLAGSRGNREGQPLRFIAVGRLAANKRIDALIEAFGRLCEDFPAELTIVGDGPERGRLEALATPAARARIRWLGKLAYDDALAHYGSADAFVFPSESEPWGLVVNEAMAAGLPVIARSTAGAAVDLVENGVTGWTLADSSPDAVYEAMRRCALDPRRARAMGLAAQRKIQRWNYDATVDGFVAALSATAPPRAPVALLTGA